MPRWQILVCGLLPVAPAAGPVSMPTPLCTVSGDIRTTAQEPAHWPPGALLMRAQMAVACPWPLLLDVFPPLFEVGLGVQKFEPRDLCTMLPSHPYSETVSH